MPKYLNSKIIDLSELYIAEPSQALIKKSLWERFRDKLYRKSIIILQSIQQPAILLNWRGSIVSTNKHFSLLEPVIKTDLMNTKFYVWKTGTSSPPFSITKDSKKWTYSIAIYYRTKLSTILAINDKTELKELKKKVGEILKILKQIEEAEKKIGIDPKEDVLEYLNAVLENFDKLYPQKLYNIENIGKLFKTIETLLINIVENPEHIIY